MTTIQQFLQKHIENERTLQTKTPMIKTEGQQPVTNAEKLSKMIKEHKAKQAQR